MKELSIEQKAKAYDEAIEKLRGLLEGIHEEKCEIMEEDITNIFPELAESEDERIRKYIVKVVHEWWVRCNDPSPDFPNEEKMLAYLEKQGEHAKFLSKIQEGDKVIRNENGVLVNLSQLNRIAKKQSEQNTHLPSFDEAQGTPLVKQAEQKPAEYEKPLLEKFKQAVYDCAWGKVTCKVEGESKQEYANRWAESLLLMVRDWDDDYIDSREDVIKRRAYDEGKNCHKPAEWSEEDEIGFNDALWAIQQARTIAKDENDMGNLWYAEDWLKSIKDRVQPKQEWKPSDEQMNALGVATNISNVPEKEYQELEKLYQDLLKLREE